MSPATPPPRESPLPRTWLGLLLLVALLMVGYFTLPLRSLGDDRPVLSWLIFAAALTLLTGLLLKRIADILTGTGRRPGMWLAFLICLSMVVFAATYYILAAHPGEFDGLETRLDALYFTLVTMSTIGYGDITPAAQSTRLVVMLQIVYNFVFLAAAAGTLTNQLRSGVARRVSRQQPAKDTDPPPEPGPAPGG